MEQLSEQMNELLLESGAWDGETHEAWANVAPDEKKFEALVPFCLYNNGKGFEEAITFILNNRALFREEEMSQTSIKCV